MSKILNIIELKNKINELKKENKKIVITNGCFDILHVGHVKYLKKAKTYGDILIVAINSDNSVKQIKGESRPINSQEDRSYIISQLESVDFVTIFNDISPIDIIVSIKPDIYVKGADYTIETLPEAPILLKNSIEIKFIDFIKGKSTTNIIKKIND